MRAALQGGSQEVLQVWDFRAFVLSVLRYRTYRTPKTLHEGNDVSAVQGCIPPIRVRDSIDSRKPATMSTLIGKGATTNIPDALWARSRSVSLGPRVCVAREFHPVSVGWTHDPEPHAVNPIPKPLSLQPQTKNAEPF